MYQPGEQVESVDEDGEEGGESIDYTVKPEQIHVPSLTAYEKIENSRAHVYNDYDNQINYFENYSHNSDNRNDLYKNVLATLNTNHNNCNIII